MNLRKNPFFFDHLLFSYEIPFYLVVFFKGLFQHNKKIRDIESQKPTPGHQNERKERTEMFTVMRILNIINQGVSTL